MAFKQHMQLLLVAHLLLAVEPILSTSTETVSSTVFRKDVSNIQFFKDFIFVAGNGVLYQVADNFLIESVSTCRDSPLDQCDNVTKILVINQTIGQLLLCGTGNIGQCLVGYINNLTQLSEVAMEMSDDTSQKAVAPINDSGTIIFNLTFENGVVIYQDKSFSFRYPLSTWNPLTGNTGESLKYQAMTLEDVSGNNFTIFFTAIVQTAETDYLLTNHRNENDTYVTKVVRICKNNKEYKTYGGTVLNCTIGKTTYNLVQDAVIADLDGVNGKLFVGTFKAAVSRHSAICVAKISHWNEEIKVNRGNATECPYVNDSSSQRYSIRKWKTCSHNSISPTCKHQGSVYNDTSSATSFELTPVFNLSKDKGYITKVSGTVASDSTTLVVMAGTSQGQVWMLRLRVNETNISAQEFENMTVRPNSSVRAINVQESYMYVLTRKRLDKLVVANCSRFKTCEETQSGNNPYCGWCVFQNKSTRKSDCSNTEFWIPSGQPCARIGNLEDMPADGSEKEIKFTVHHFKLGNLVQSLYCILKNNVNTFKTAVENSTVKCNITTPKEHSSSVIELRFNDIVIAESNILFYKCNKFVKCGECTKARGQGDEQGCNWYTESISCMSKSDANGLELVTRPNECPRLEGNHDAVYIPHGVTFNVTLKANNLPPSSSGFQYTCLACDVEFEAIATYSNVICHLKLDISPPEQVCQVKVLYKKQNERRYLDEDFNSTVTVYRCENLAQDCTHCGALNGTRYMCNWCGSACKYNPNKCVDTCPSPYITEIEPKTSTPYGGTHITIYGFDLNNQSNKVPEIKFGNQRAKQCSFGYNPIVDSGHFERFLPDKIICEVPGLTNTTVSTDVYVSIDNTSTSQQIFSYKVPEIWSISPKFGPVSGGTFVTFTGKNLEIGNQQIQIRFNNALDFKDCRVIQATDSTTEYFLRCRAPKTTSLSNIGVSFNIAIDSGLGKTYEYLKEKNKNLTFDFISSPEINDLQSHKCILSGGIAVTVTGESLNHSHRAVNTVIYDGQKQAQECDSIEKTQVICRCPVAPESVQSDLRTLITSISSNKRRKREMDETPIDKSILAQLIVELDGVQKSFLVIYYPDPFFYSYREVQLFESDENTLVISGINLNLAATEKDIIVKIGIDTCSVEKLTLTELTCVVYRSDNNGDHEVNVQIGNYHQKIGYVRFKHPFDENTYIIAGSVGSSVLAIIVIGAVVAVIKFRRRNLKTRHLKNKLHNLEHEMRNVAREEFRDMNITMSGVNQNLVEQGFPYHGYLKYASNVIFSSGYIHMETDKSMVQVSERVRLGLETLEQLLCNKFFLLPMISTMEKQKKFFLREKANFAGHLCQVMMGKMEYLDEIIGLLIQSQVQEAVKKKHQKSLFSGSESITENLLNNWLFLCLYHHIRADTGSPLYLMYVIMRETMESGPIDAVSGDAKFTLCEKKLLKKWWSPDSDKEDKISSETKSLNLRVIVDNGRHVYDCKALDCDTITQVKRKCLRQIYVNYPASQLAVDATDLKLNWHGNSSGLLPLADKDITSRRDGDWLRLNTLAHYKVPNDANMAIVDPKGMDLQHEEVYENPECLMDARAECRGADNLNQTQDTSDKDLSKQEWHLVKPVTLDEKHDKEAIDELYLSRLTTTKYSVVKYMTGLFDVILSQPRCPAPVKRIFDLFDSLEAKHKLDSDTIYKWKSHSYLIRVWGSLMTDPSKLFDINVPPYVESSLGVVSQVFIDACSQASTEVTKDTSPQKLSFMNIVKQFKVKVATFFDEVKAVDQSQEELRQYLDVVNKLQRQQNFRKDSSLRKIYDQLKPYMEIIIEELSQNKEASSLLLNEKLSQVIKMIEEDM